MKKRAQPWLGTLVEISISDDLPDAQLNHAFQQAFARVAQIHALMSFHAPDSEVTRINLAPVGARLALHPHTYAVIAGALRVCQASAGLFDIRVASLLAEWAYLPRPAPQVPAYQPQAIAWRLGPDSSLEKLRPDWMDLGGIAKGYAVDQAILTLQQAGVQQACVNAGGDLRVLGAAALEVGIRDPDAPSRIAHRLYLQNQALATSGTYFSLKPLGNAQVSALINGLSAVALSAPGSISVRAPQCVWADALSKVVAASGDAQHPCLDQFSAEAFIIRSSA